MKRRQLLLEMRHCYRKRILFDPASGNWAFESPARRESRESQEETVSGFASTSEISFAAFYKNEGVLWIALESHLYPVTDELTSTWSMEKWVRSGVRRRNPLSVLKPRQPVQSGRKFELIQSGRVVERKAYTVLADPDVRPFTSWGEDLEDFLLWIHEVLQNKSKQTDLLRIWK